MMLEEELDKDNAYRQATDRPIEDDNRTAVGQVRGGSFRQDCGSHYFCHCFGSGLDPGFNQDSGSMRAKMTHKSRKKLRNFMLWSAGCSLLRAEGNKFLTIFGLKTLDPDWIRVLIGTLPKRPDLDPYQMNTDPKHWLCTDSDPAFS